MKSNELRKIFVWVHLTGEDEQISKEVRLYTYLTDEV